MRTARPLLQSALAAALVSTAFAGTAHGSEPVVSRGVTIPVFYNPPAALPAANGALIRTEPLPLGLTLPGLDGKALPGTATRLMYRSTDSNGLPVAVTGAYLEPSAAWTGGGPRPLVALASGTMGQGDQCSPSFALQNPATLTGDTVSVGYEVLSIYALLDAARAAHTVPGASVTAASRVGLYGYSQGGGASAAAAELQPSYAPDVKVAGTYAGAPPADLASVTKGIDGSALAGALGWSVNGFAQSDPALRNVVDNNINAVGRAALQNLSTMCVGDAILTYPFTSSTKWTNNGTSLSDIIAADPQAKAVLDRQRIGKLKPVGPVRLATGLHDDIVPHAQARQLAVDWCNKGGNVTYVPVKLDNLGDKILLNHLVPLITDQADAVSWLTDRLAGKATPNNCWTMVFQP